eukprot:2689525-Rhodomonas_salina.3
MSERRRCVMCVSSEVEGRWCCEGRKEGSKRRGESAARRLGEHCEDGNTASESGGGCSAEGGVRDGDRHQGHGAGLKAIMMHGLCCRRLEVQT